MVRALAWLLLLITVAPAADLAGRWQLIPALSTDIDLFSTVTLDLEPAKDDHTLRLIATWSRGQSAHRDTLDLRPDGEPTHRPLTHRNLASNVFMGLSCDVGADRVLASAWRDPGRDLAIREDLPIRSSQGRTTLAVDHRLTLDPAQDLLTWEIHRPTRPDDRPLHFVFKRPGARQAYLWRFDGDWRLDGDLPAQALILTLQGLANRDRPRLYGLYPEDWDFRFTPDLRDHLANERGWTFTELPNLAAALTHLADHARGYVVWDPAVRASLLVGFTVAGLEDAVLVTAEQIPLAEAAGLPLAEDLRGRYDGLDDAAVHRRARDRYWDRCSREMVVWLGGHAGAVAKPGVADWAVANRAFCTDLSCDPADTEEYTLADALLADLPPLAYCFGWHSYGKDRERDHVRLCSSHAIRVEGLHTLPNLSFMSQVPATPGFVWRNHHSLAPGERPRPEARTYIACIQTDCLGLGAWTRPGRGEIPYAWEVTLNWSHLAPALLEFFYEQATPNDYFIGSLGGPGYVYPKAVPPAHLPAMVAEVRRLMDLLDLNVFEIMDYSEGATVSGNTELTREVMDAFYAGLPDALGFVNGYAPAHTFDCREGRPLVSFDYYLSPERPVADAVADLRELAAINAARPYFLLMHVRQWSDISRVKEILDLLPPEEFAVVPLDRFLVMAGQAPTFAERYRGE
jgi:hypothetical protein